MTRKGYWSTQALFIVLQSFSCVDIICSETACLVTSNKGLNPNQISNSCCAIEQRLPCMTYNWIRCLLLIAKHDFVFCYILYHWIKFRVKKLIQYYLMLRSCLNKNHIYSNLISVISSYVFRMNNLVCLFIS